MKFIKEGFRGVPNGQIYAQVFVKGEDCPKELEKAALEQGYLKQVSKKGESDQGKLVVEPEEVISGIELNSEVKEA